MLHIMKYLSEALSVLPQNCTAESRAVHKYKAAQAPTGNFLASLCHINETRKHYSAVFISHFFPGNAGYGHCSLNLARQMEDFLNPLDLEIQLIFFFRLVKSPYKMFAKRRPSPKKRKVTQRTFCLSLK